MTRGLVAAIVLLFAVPGVARADGVHGVALFVLDPRGEDLPHGVPQALTARGFQTTILNDRAEDLRFRIEQFIRTAPTNGQLVLFIHGATANRTVGADRIVELVRTECGAVFCVALLDTPAETARPEMPAGMTLLLRTRKDEDWKTLVGRLADSTAPLAPDLPPILRARRPPHWIGAGARAGEEWVNPLGTVFCWCPPGNGQAGFWFGKYEVTKREFDLVTKKMPREALAVLPNHPRDGIRYDDILTFVRELNWRERFLKRLPEGWEYALPTESEWEYACRAGTESGRDFYFGDGTEDLPAHANFADRRLFDTGEEYYLYAERDLDDGIARLATAGRYRPNPWGLHDLYGNLWEWTATVEEHGGRRYPVARGGSWVSLPGYCTSAFRHRFEASTERNFIGFRLTVRRTSPESKR